MKNRQYNLREIESAAGEWANAKDQPLVSAVLAVAERIEELTEAYEAAQGLYQSKTDLDG